MLDGREEKLPDGHPAGSPVVRPDKRGAGIVVASDTDAFLHFAFFHDGTKNRRYDEVETVVYSRDGSRYAYAARKGIRWFIVVNGQEGPAFDRVVMPVFIPDGTLVAYGVKDGNKLIWKVEKLDK